MASRRTMRNHEELQQLLLENSEDVAEEQMFGGAASDVEDNVDTHSESETDVDEDSDVEMGSEYDSNNVASTSVQLGRKRSILRGKNGFKWSTKEPQRRGKRSRSLAIYLPAGKGRAKEIRTPLQAWSLLFDDGILEKVVRHTNEEIERQRASIQRQTYHHDITDTELKAFLGLMYFSGVQKTHGVNLDELWDVTFGITLFRATMPLLRFKFISVCLRFDDKQTRAQRKETDRLAPIREVWEKFIENCRQHYSPSEFCTVDEQLLSFRGRCPFRIYMPAKPDKYGMKIVMFNDAKTFYMMNASPYVGKVQTENLEPVPSMYVRTLTEPVHGSNRNITCDNWFTSVGLVDTMRNKYGLTVVGTIRKNKREIPTSFTKPKDEGTSEFAFSDNKVLVSYTPKKNRVVLLLSSRHHNASIDPVTGKPEIICMYNETKGGTDSFDQLCHAYTTARKTNRWPMRFWCGMLDQGGVNSMILYNLLQENKKMIRRIFLKHLSFALIEPFLKQRVAVPSLRRSLRVTLEEILNIEVPMQRDECLTKKVRCSFCPRDKHRKTQNQCVSCKQPMCGEHRSFLCIDCSNAE